MPKIIRSTGVNIDNARPIVMPIKPKQQAEAADTAKQAEAQAQAKEQARAAVERDRQEREKIQASAGIIVDEILSRARNDADNMLVDARAETMKILQEAVQEGREQGLNEALKEMHDLRDDVEARVDSAIKSLREERHRLIMDLEHDMLELVFDIAEKVLVVEMNRSDEWVASLVKAALLQMDGEDSVLLKVSESARQRVAEAVGRMLEACGKQQSGLTVLSVSTLPPGGCVIETAKGVINNGVEDKFDKLKTVLRENA